MADRLLEAVDLDRGAHRAFALKDILRWTSEANTPCRAEQQIGSH
jgi:hypothetical protein